MKRRNLWRGLTAIFAVLLIVTQVLSGVAFEYSGLVDEFLGLQTAGKLELDPNGTVYYPSEYGNVLSLTADDLTDLQADEDAFCAEIVEEGAVLLLNNGALPLAESERNVTLLGRAVADPVFKGFSNGGDMDPARQVDFKTAMTNKGFQINETVYTAYENSETERDRKKSYIGEEEISFYTDELKNSFASHGDAAIIMLSRFAGEASDLAVSDAQGVPQLSLHQEERDLINLAVSSGTFQKIIVVLNSAYPMEVDEFEALQVDACLWIGNPGLTGFNGLASILTGETNPSGRLVDTYATNSLSSPAMQNFGDFKWENQQEVYDASVDNTNGVMGGAMNDSYVVYTEGIYTGYKYYETRYEDCILNQGNASSEVGIYASTGENWNYAEEVTYPFGYGLSYTTFTETLDSVTEEEDSFTVQITVTNTGSVAGKKVVQLYAQRPYTEYAKENLMEVPSVQIIGFAKTSLLEPGESEQVTIVADKYLLIGYDTNGAKGYVMDAGDYYLSLGDNAHVALNHILAAKGAKGMYDEKGNPVEGNVENTWKWHVEERDTETWRYSEYTGNEITNVLMDGDINTWIPGAATYLTRQDWENTWPAPLSLTATEDMIEELTGYTYEKPADAPSVDEFKTEVDSGLVLKDMVGVEFDDPKWDTFLDQMSLSELGVALDDNLSTGQVDSIAKPKSLNTDGPNGIYGKYMQGDRGYCTGYAAQVVLASTWSADMLSRYGNFLAEDALFSGSTQVWAPGGNLHRAPYGGRNFEYYSECGIMAYLLAIPQVQAMVERGVHVAPKHFVGNEQETNRTGVATFATEQCWRETVLRGFESSFTIGGALGTMTAYNRIGCTFAGASAPLLNQLLRGEWGFKGTTITDNAMYGYIHTVESLVGGTDMFCFNKRSEDLIKLIESTDDGYLVECMREANHRYYYASVNSNLANGLPDEIEQPETVSWWQTALNVVEIAVIILLVCTTVCYVISGIWALKKRKERGTT